MTLSRSKLAAINLGPHREPESVSPANDQLPVDDVLDVLGAAVLLKIGRNAVYAGCARLAIPHRRIGKHLRFSRAALLRWLAGQKP